MNQSLTIRDSHVIWHPYTQHKNMLPPLPIVKAQGAMLYDENGKGYIDAISSWWVNIHGHAHPYIAKKIYEQASLLDQVIFTGFTHEPAVNLAERLLAILPGNFSRIFYSDNGSTAVEVAIKMALQYWKNIENTLPVIDDGGTAVPVKTRRNKVLAFKHAYHGDTFGAMSVSGRSVFTEAFNEYLFDVVFVDTPTKENLHDTIRFIRQYAGELACFIYEPLLQGAGGMLTYDAAHLDELLAVVKENNIVCIADEVLTGFGRTGKLFAGMYLRQKADVICLSKGLTGGSMAMGVTACSQTIFEAFLHDDKMKTFFHGHSFTANPIACAASLASLDLLESEDCLSKISHIVDRQRGFILRVSHPDMAASIKNARQIGTIIAFEINSGDDGYLNKIGAGITAQALEKGIYLRPLGNTVYIMPPYCITDDQLDKVYAFLLGIFGKDLCDERG